MCVMSGEKAIRLCGFVTDILQYSVSYHFQCGIEPATSWRKRREKQPHREEEEASYFIYVMAWLKSMGRRWDWLCAWKKAQLSWPASPVPITLLHSSPHPSHALSMCLCLLHALYASPLSCNGNLYAWNNLKIFCLEKWHHPLLRQKNSAV